jgi:hypothetical protein
MTFDAWWKQLTAAEQKSIGAKNAEFVWAECQKYTLMTIEDACKAETAYAEGFRQGRERFVVHIAGWVLTRGSRPGMIWISDAGGEGGDFHIHELAAVIGQFYSGRF